MKWIRDNAITLLIVFGIGIALLLDHQSNHTGLEHQRTALVQACEQRNRIVAESNQRIPQHRREEHVVRSLLISAARARKANYRQTHQASDKRAFVKYHVLIDKLALVHFDRIPYTNCEATVR